MEDKYTNKEIKRLIHRRNNNNNKDYLPLVLFSFFIIFIIRGVLVDSLFF